MSKIILVAAVVVLTMAGAASAQVVHEGGPVTVWVSGRPARRDGR